jgi:hypothetical protein
MILSDAQVQRFWREWAKTCQIMNWTREAGMTSAQIDAKRKELLAACGFSSLTKVDRTAGFTKVLNELLVIQGTSLKAAHETIDPSLNEARILRNHILTELVPCLELYVEDVRVFLTQIMEDKTRYRKTDRPDRDLNLMDLNAGQLKHMQFTLAARLNDKRKAAGDTIHDMKIKASVPCSCAECRDRRNLATLAQEAPEAAALVNSGDPF